MKKTTPEIQLRNRLPVRYFAFLLTGLSLLATPVFANQSEVKTLKPFIAKYVAENNYITGGKATLSLIQNDKGNFDFTLQTTPTGIFKWTGKGNIREHAELPQLTKPFESVNYTYTDRGDSDRSYKIVFDRSNSEFNFRNKGKTATHPLPASTLDRLSVTLAVMHEANQNKNFSSISVQSLDKTRTQQIIFNNSGTDQISTSLGKVSALRINKERDSSNRDTIIWLAQLDGAELFIPVKIEHFKRGKLTLRLIITSFSAVE